MQGGGVGGWAGDIVRRERETTEVSFQGTMVNMSEGNSQTEKLALLQKINDVFLGTRDFRELAKKSVNLMTEELKSEKVLGTGIFRVHEKEDLLYAYAYSARAFDAVEKLLPAKFSELTVPLSAKTNLYIKAIDTKQPQQSHDLYDFAHPTLTKLISAGIQKAIGFSLGIAYPLRRKNGKIEGVLFFVTENDTLTDEQRILLETFRMQFELALENVAEFEQVIERYKRSVAKTFPKDHRENVPTIRFTLRITPKQNKILEQIAKEKGTDKASLIRTFIDKVEK